MLQTVLSNNMVLQIMALPANVSSSYVDVLYYSNHVILMVVKDLMHIIGITEGIGMQILIHNYIHFEFIILLTLRCMAQAGMHDFTGSIILCSKHLFISIIQIIILF